MDKKRKILDSGGSSRRILSDQELFGFQTALEQRNLIGSLPPPPSSKKRPLFGNQSGREHTSNDGLLVLGEKRKTPEKFSGNLTGSAVKIHQNVSHSSRIQLHQVSAPKPQLTVFSDRCKQSNGSIGEPIRNKAFKPSTEHENQGNEREITSKLIDTVFEHGSNLQALDATVNGSNSWRSPRTLAETEAQFESPVWLRRGDRIPLLCELSVRSVRENHARVDYLGALPDEMVLVILRGAKCSDLERIEKCNPGRESVFDVIWAELCAHELGVKRLSDQYNRWRDLYRIQKANFESKLNDSIRRVQEKCNNSAAEQTRRTIASRIQILPDPQKHLKNRNSSLAFRLKQVSRTQRKSRPMFPH